jgi:hypothetical protein
VGVLTNCVVASLLVGSGAVGLASERGRCAPPAKPTKAEMNALLRRASAEHDRKIQALIERHAQAEKNFGESSAAAAKRLNELQGAIQSQAVRLENAEKKLEGDPRKERLQTAAWTAALVAALVAALSFLVAALSFRKGVYQSRATTLLAIQKQSDELGESAKAVATLRNEARRIRMEKQTSGLSSEQASLAAREACSASLAQTRTDAGQLDLYRHYMRYVGFFEKIGLMVRHRYVPLRDLVGLYKGPILEVQYLFGEHIAALQKENVGVRGIFENALFLVNETSRYEQAPPYLRRWRSVKDWF